MAVATGHVVALDAASVAACAWHTDHERCAGRAGLVVVFRPAPIARMAMGRRHDQGNSDAVRDMYFEELEFLEAVFAKQPFILGSHPSAADFGYFASMFRHFGNDPDPAEVMRAQAPHTYAWLARLWDTKAQDLGTKQQWVFPKGPHWAPLLDRIANEYLPYLKANAEAFRDQKNGSILSVKTQLPPHQNDFLPRVVSGNLATSLSGTERTRQSPRDGLFAPVGKISKILNARQISAGMDDLFAMPKPSLKGTHITLSRRGLAFGRATKKLRAADMMFFLTKLFLTAGIIVVITEVAKKAINLAD